MEFDCGPVEMPSKITVSPVNTIAQTNSAHNQYITQTMDRYRKKKITTNIGTTQDDIGVMNSTHTSNAKHSSMSHFYQDDSTVLKNSEFFLNCHVTFILNTYLMHPKIHAFLHVYTP